MRKTTRREIPDWVPEMRFAVLQRLSNLIDRDTAAYDEYLDLFQKYMVSPP